MLKNISTGVSTLALTTAVSLFAGAALAQTAAGNSSAKPDAGSVEAVVVTGSAIRGVASVGSNLVSVGQEELKSLAAINANQLVNSVPSITNSGSAPQGENVFNYYAPAIHALGASGSNTTLVMIDGMRIVGGGTQFAQADPNITPTASIQRVEVLADGASSIYGSDAVAGVVNFLTRNRFNGVEVNGKLGYGNHYKARDASIIAGKVWEDGWVYVAASHAKQGTVTNAARPFLSRGDYRAIGGTNMLSYNCSPATIRTPASGNNIYLSPSATAAVAQTADNAQCNNSIYGSAIPGIERDNFIVKGSVDLNEKLTVSGSVMYNHLFGSRAATPGTLTNITVFGPGSGRGAQINPFFRAPAGDPTATQETINFINLSGDPGKTNNGNDSVQFYGFVDYKLPMDWTSKLSYGFGWSDSYTGNENVFCAPCATLALNGTAAANGSLTASQVPNQTIIATQILSTANALDVWNAAGAGNRTSEATLRSILGSDTRTEHFNKQHQTKIEFQGPLFDLPAGKLRMGVGGEYFTATQNVKQVGTGTVSPTAAGATYTLFNLARDVYSAYAELAVPVISREMGIPLVQELDLNLSYRYDKYNDVGTTTNPKIAANWRPTDWLKIRGNYATAFVAPPLGAIGDASQGGIRGNGGASVSGSITVPVSAYPQVTSVPGADCARVTTCIIGLSSNQGLQRVFGGIVSGVKPATGKSWSLGADFNLQQAIPGLTANVTYFYNEFRGGVNSTNASTIVGSPALQSKLQICPTRCTQAQIDAFTRVSLGAPLGSSIPADVYFLLNNDAFNLVNIDLTGIDYLVNWRVPTESAGTFRFSASGTYYTQFDQNILDQPSFSTLGTSGYNQQFPSLKVRTRWTAGWELGGFSADVFVNYTPGYRNWSATSVTPVITNTIGPISGGDKVKADIITDATVTYEFQSGMLEGAAVYVNVTNLFDEDPPFYNGNTGGFGGIGAAGFNGLVSNPIGRVSSVGFRAKF